MANPYQIGDQVRFVDRCEAKEGVVVAINGEFVEIKTQNSVGYAVRDWMLASRVFRHDDVAGFVAHLRDQAGWMIRQADQLENQ